MNNSLSATCVPWCLLRGNTGLSRHGDPVFLHFCPGRTWHVLGQGGERGGGTGQNLSVNQQPTVGGQLMPS